MHTKAVLKYFRDINIFNIPFSLLVGLTSGFLWTIVSFASIGILFGFLGFQTFKKDEYFMYYNLGITKSKLLIATTILNGSISILFFLIYLILK